VLTVKRPEPVEPYRHLPVLRPLRIDLCEACRDEMHAWWEQFTAPALEALEAIAQ
jgi:hypothetical protein